MTTTYVPPPPPAAPPTAPPAKGSSGCLKWGLIGCGCVTVIAAVCVAVLVFVVFAAIRRSEVYKESLRRVQNDARVVAALGSPVEQGYWVTGKINFDTNGGIAKIDYPVHGPNGRASVHVEATKEPDHPWEYTDITAKPANGPPIDVLRP